MDLKVDKPDSPTDRHFSFDEKEFTNKNQFNVSYLRFKFIFKGLILIIKFNDIILL